MQQKINKNLLRLCFFSGEDSQIIKDASSSIKISFASIGVFVILIFVGCCISAGAYVYELFEKNIWISLPIGIIWGLLMANMYLLLLYTISPAILPSRKKLVEIDSNSKKFIQWSLIFRICFIGMLAIIIAQPLNVLLLTNYSTKSLEFYKSEYKATSLIEGDSVLIKKEVDLYNEFKQKLYTKKIETYREVDSSYMSLFNKKNQNDRAFLIEVKIILDSLNKLKLKKQIVSYQATQLKRDSLFQSLNLILDQNIKQDEQFLIDIESFNLDNDLIIDDFNKFKFQIIEIVNKKSTNYKQLIKLLEASNFYTTRIKLILSENPFSWFFTIIIILIFMLPIRVKYIIRNSTDFYELKKQIEENMVLNEYQKFRKLYTIVLTEKINNINLKTKEKLKYYIDKLYLINSDKAHDFEFAITKDLEVGLIEKYEHFDDPPFRTKTKKSVLSIIPQEKFLLSIYNNKN